MITIAYNVHRYRALLADTVAEGDTVIEIGPHRCASTNLYVEKAGKVVLVDKGLDCADALKSYCEKHENTDYVMGDSRSFKAVKEVLEKTKKCDVFAVDLGGGRFPDTVFKVWATWSGIFSPRDSVIRCRGLAEFVRKAKVCDETLPEQFKDSGWLTEYGRKTPYALKKQLDEFSHWVDVD